MGTDLSKAKGLKRVSELLSGSRAKKLHAAVERDTSRAHHVTKAYNPRGAGQPGGAKDYNPSVEHRSSENRIRAERISGGYEGRVVRTDRERRREKEDVLTSRIIAGSLGTGAAAVGARVAHDRKKEAFAEAVRTIAEGIKAAALGTIVSKASQVGRIGGTMTTNALKTPGVAATAQAINPRRSMTQAMGAFKAR